MGIARGDAFNIAPPDPQVGKIVQSDDVRTKVRHTLARYKQVAAAYVFGSRAKGEVREGSDWDFAVLLGRGFENPYDLVSLIGDLEQDLGTPENSVDVVVLNSADLEIAFKAVAEGELVYEQDRQARIDYEVQLAKLYSDAKPLLTERRHRLEAELLRQKSSSTCSS